MSDIYEGTWHIVHDDGRLWDDDELEGVALNDVRKDLTPQLGKVWGVAATAGNNVFVIDGAMRAHLIPHDVRIVEDHWHLEHSDGRPWTKDELDKVIGISDYKLSLDERWSVWVIPVDGHSFELSDLYDDDMEVVWDAD